MHNRRVDWVVMLACLAIAISGCGGGCGGCGMQPIPGGFPSAKRAPNAAQVRVTQSGLTAISADPAALLGSLGTGMNGVLSFNAPASCGGSTPICCPGGNPVNPCGPINIDISMHPGDLPRMELRPAQGASRLDVVVRARVTTMMDIPVGIPVVGNCGIKIDTNAGTPDDITINAPISFAQDATAGTTRVVVGTVTVANLASEDVALTGGIGCQLANLGLSFFLGILTDQITGAIQSAIQDQTCKACESGMVSECGPFATACTDKVCMEGNQCLQELGIAGRLPASALFGGLSPGTTGALDLYEVAGGYATTNTNGIALGLLGGMQPGGVARDKCGPSAVEPPAVTIPQSAFFQGNTRPDTGAAFDVGFGIHKSQLAQFAWAGYDGGLLCLTIGGSTVAQLNTDTLSLLSRSLGDLVDGNAPMAIGLRPQSPPVITLGKNTFKDDGQGNQVLDVPLLDLKFNQMEIDFFTSVDDQYVRVFTLVTDVHLPIGLQVMGMGQLTPVIGSIADAFTNLSVKNSEAVTESPAQLAGLFPTLLNLVLPQLSGGLSPVSLPSIGGLNLEVTGITSVDNDNFLAIFANLAMASNLPPETVNVVLAGVTDGDPAVAKRPAQWKSARAPSVQLDFGREPALEWSYRVNGGTWSAWSSNPHPTISSEVFWLAGQHKIEVHARRVGQPETISVLPALVEVVFGEGAKQTAKVAPFHGQPGSQGCACDSSGAGAVAAAPFMLMILALLLPLRRIGRRMRRLGGAAWLAALACLPGCSCGDAPCGDTECLEGEVPSGGLGRFNSIAADDKRVMVATYDTGLGDLVVVDATDASAPKYYVVDGIPDDVTPTYDPDTYRGGIEDAGPNVGAWTAIGLVNGKAVVAYQDRDAKALKIAREKKPGSWTTYALDAPEDVEDIGQHAAMTIDGSNHPAIAYLAVGIDDGMNHRVTELRLKRASSAEPNLSDWSTSLIASTTGTCAGLCGAGTACIAADTAGDPEVCTPIANNCPAACDSGDVCIAGGCTTPLAAPTVATLASGSGMYVTLNTMPDGRLAATYYDRNRRALVLALESGAGSNTFAETVLDTVTPGDRGMWATSVVDGAGTIHVAYQDAIGDQVMYTSYSGTVGAPQLVDDGTRAGDRTHNVGAGAAIYLVNGAPTIAYQDGLKSDVYVATKAGSTWTSTPVAQGLLLDGFAIAVTTARGAPIAAWGQIDPSQNPNRLLVVKQP